MKLNRIKPNNIRAKSLIRSSQQAIKSVSNLAINETNKKTILRELYEGLRQFCEAIGYINGYKFFSHEDITIFLKEILKESSISMKFDRYRKLRNGINYYGNEISEEEVTNALQEIPRVISLLNKYIKNIGII
jgi:hypothetical protein